MVTVAAALGILAVQSTTARASWSVAERVSVATGGGEANGGSDRQALSFDGRYVAFQSDATNLVTDDTNGVSDVFVRDRTGITTVRVSVSTGGSEGDALSVLPGVSGDGRYVAFQSDATNLVTDDTNGASDVFIRDLVSGTTERVSTSTAGDGANGPSGSPSVSWDGRFVAFFALASNLVVGDTNSWWDVFVKDRSNGATQRVSVATGGSEGDNMSYAPAISFDGRYVAFTSRATDLVTDDANGIEDIFVRDRVSASTERVSVSTSGGSSNGSSDRPSISYDGNTVSYETLATNLITDDANGDWDVYVRDRSSSRTERASVSEGGGEALGRGAGGAISWDGSRVAFTSAGSLVVGGDTNLVTDAFVRDRTAMTTYRTSIAGATEINSGVVNAAISGDGRASGFATIGDFGPTLVDTNGAVDVYVSSSGEPALTTTPSPISLPEMTPGPPPASPSDLEATPTSSSSVDLTWSDNSGDETLFKIERRTGSDPWSQVATVGSDVTAYSDTGLSPATIYDYRVRAANPDQNSGYSNEASATTFSALPPADPGSLTATAISGTQVNLSWSDNSTGETGFVIERRTPPDGFTEVATVGSNVTTYSDLAVAPVTTYVYRLAATGPGGQSGYSDEVTVTTPTDSPPAAPSSLTVLTTTADQAFLEWADNSVNETGFEVQRSSSGTPFLPIASLGPGITTYVDSTLSPSITYDYRIVAVNTGGASTPSNVATTVTRPAPVCRQSQIVFVSDRNSNSEIYVMNPDGSGLRRVTDTSSNEAHPVFAPSGDRIYFSSDDSGNSQIYSVNIDGSNRRRLTDNLANDLNPVISPDGLSIAFNSDRSGSSQIWIMEADGADQTQITSSGGIDASPSFAPAGSGRKLAYHGSASGSFQIYTLTYTVGPYAAGLPSRISPSDTSNQVFPAWSPNGTNIAFITDIDAPVPELYNWSLSTSTASRLTTNSAIETKPYFTNDGSSIVFASDVSGDLEIYRVAATGGVAARLTTDAAIDTEPSQALASPWAIAPSANFLAEGASTGGFDTWILMSNPSATTPVTACVTYLTDAGAVAGPLVTIPPQSRVSRSVGATVQTFNVSTVVEGIDGQVVAERAMYSSRSDIPGAHDGLAVPAPATRWHAAEGSTANGFDTWILVANPSRTQTASVNLNFLTSTGQRPGPSNQALAPGQRQSFRIASSVPNEADVSTEVTSTGAAVLVERASYVNTAQFKGATDSPAINNPATAWFLTEGAAAGPFTTWILVENPQSTAARVTLRFLTSGGEIVGPTADLIPPRSRRSYPVRSYIPAGDFNVSTEVTSDLPVVAERAMYTNDASLGRGASTGEGVGQAGTDWLAVEGAAAGGFTTWILVANPNSTVACVDVNFLTAAGAVSYGANPVCLFPRSRKSIRVNDALAPTFDVSTRVTSVAVGSGPSSVPVRPVIVERSVYTPAGVSQDSTTGPAYRLA